MYNFISVIDPVGEEKALVFSLIFFCFKLGVVELQTKA